LSQENSKIKNVCVIGAGQMGGGIAHICALSGYETSIYDIERKQLESVMSTIEHNLQRQVDKKKITQKDKHKAHTLISTYTDIDCIKDADLIIEAATEDEVIKKKIFSQVCPLLKKNAILCTNTSSISITRLGAATDRPNQFMGLHFMNPVPVMKLVELIRSIATDVETFESIKNFTASLGKKTVSSEDFPAFIVNRILIPMINEGVYTLYEGVGSVSSIDSAMKLGANHPMGPLELADFIGLDTCLSIMTVLYEGLSDSKYRPCPLLVKYVEAGWLGKKSGKGFYDYSGNSPSPTR